MDLGVYDVDGARRRIAGTIVRTPSLRSLWLSDLIGQPIHLKLECLQATRSFKLRGAASKILALPGEDRRRGVIATSSGNHGLAVATVAARLDVGAVICVPRWIDPSKLRGMRRAGAEVVVEGETADEAEAVSLDLAQRRGLTYVHPFDDPHVIAGQGTCGLEIAEQVADVRQVLVPMSGGGLIGGIGVALRQAAPKVAVVAASARRAAVLSRSLDVGRMVELPERETIATALAGNLGAHNEHTLALAAELVTERAEVGEEEIVSAIRVLFHRHGLVVEGGGAVAVAALMHGRVAVNGPTVVVVSGGNIDPARLTAILAAEANGG